MPRAGDIIDLNCELWDGRTNVFVRAHLFDASGTELTQSPVVLSHLGFGLYTNSTVPMPLTREVKAIYEIFLDSGFMIPSPFHSNAVDAFELEVPVEKPTDVAGILVQDRQLAGVSEIDVNLSGVLLTGSLVGELDNDKALLGVLDENEEPLGQVGNQDDETGIIEC